MAGAESAKPRADEPGLRGLSPGHTPFAPRSIPEQASVPEAWKVFTEDGKISDPQLEERLKEVGRQVARFARLHKCENALEFVRSWQKAQANPGA